MLFLKHFIQYLYYIIELYQQFYLIRSSHLHKLIHLKLRISSHYLIKFNQFLVIHHFLS